MAVPVVLELMVVQLLHKQERVETVFKYKLQEIQAMSFSMLVEEALVLGHQAHLIMLDLVDKVEVVVEPQVVLEAILVLVVLVELLLVELVLLEMQIEVVMEETTLVVEEVEMVNQIIPHGQQMLVVDLVDLVSLLSLILLKSHAIHRKTTRIGSI